MKIEITEYEKNYTFDMQPVTQLCGQNVRKKSYILESLRRYFGTYKYAEVKNKWRDNVLIEGQQSGRKYFSVISVKQNTDIIQMIKCSKQSLMMEYIKKLMQKFDWQSHLRIISEEVDEMFRMINGDVGKLGDIELTYTMSEVWDMVQKSDVSGINDTDLLDKSDYELIIILLNLVDSITECNPKKTMVIFENIDYMVEQNEYVEILRRAEQISRKYDVHFVFSSSLEGYVYFNEELCQGISVFGDVDFQMPELEKICTFISNNYPYAKDISVEHIQNILSRIIQRIGMKDYLYSVEENVVCKMINQSLLLYDRMPEEKMLEMAFLRA